MQEVELRSPRGFSSADYGGLGARRPEEGVGGRDGGEGGGKGKGKGDGEWKVRTKYEMKRRKQNCLIGWAFLVALVGLSAVFALLAIQANKPGGVAG